MFRAEIGGSEVEPAFDLPIRLLRHTDGAGGANAFEARGDVDAVAHQVAVRLLDHVTQMNADAEFDAALARQAGVALNHAVLDLDGAAHRVDQAAKLDKQAIAGALDHATVMHSDGRVDQVAAEAPQTRKRPVLVRAREPAVAHDIRDQDCRDFARFPHGATPPRPCQPFRVVRAKPLGGLAKTREECRSLA